MSNETMSGDWSINKSTLLTMVVVIVVLFGAMWAIKKYSKKSGSTPSATPTPAPTPTSSGASVPDPIKTN